MSLIFSTLNFPTLETLEFGVLGAGLHISQLTDLLLCFVERNEKEAHPVIYFSARFDHSAIIS